MNWKAVSEELARISKSQEALITNPSKHNDIRQSAAIVSAVLRAFSLALDEGMRPPIINGGDPHAQGLSAAPSIPPTPR